MDISLALGSSQPHEIEPSGARDQDKKRPLSTKVLPHLVATFEAEKTRKSSDYILRPPAAENKASDQDRAAYFKGLLKVATFDFGGRMQKVKQAATLLDLMTLRAFHSNSLRCYSVGTAIGFRTRGGILTNIPAVIVFVRRKVHEQWLLDFQKYPSNLVGPNGLWCDVDVIEFSFYGGSAVVCKEQLYTDLVERLRGQDPCIGSGSQVASQEFYGTVGGIVRSVTAGEEQKVGFLTNRHVAVDLDYANQKTFHPLPDNLGPGVYLGSVERAVSFIPDDLWFGIYASFNTETFVRAHGAFIPFAESFDLSRVTTSLRGVGDIGEVMPIDLKAPIDSLIGQHVIKVGRSSGLTKGEIRAYAAEYNDETSVSYYTDFLVMGENELPFDLDGDSGSLVLLVGEEDKKTRPFGIIWGGTVNRGRLKLCSGRAPLNWTSCIDLGRLLALLELELLTSDSQLTAIIEDKRLHQQRTKEAQKGRSPQRFDSWQSGVASCGKQNYGESHRAAEERQQLLGTTTHKHKDLLSTLTFNVDESQTSRPQSLSGCEDCNLSLGGSTRVLSAISSVKQQRDGNSTGEEETPFELGEDQNGKRRKVQV